MTPLLAIHNVEKKYGKQTVLRDVSFTVSSGEAVGLIGPNGAGKTTLLATLAGLRAPDAGTLFYDGVPLAALPPRARARKRGLLPQDSVDFFPASVLETVLIGRHPHLGRLQWESTADIDCARAALARFGLAGFEGRDIRTLSGGERRRTALAALVAQDPDLMLLDEPSSHLDLGQQIAALEAVTALARDHGKAIVMVLHDLHLAARFADHAIALGGGRARTGAAVDILTAAALSELFGHRLVRVGEGATATFVPS